MIYVVRHGQTDWNIEKRYAGRVNVPLNETGVSEAYELAVKLQKINFDVVFSSPLSRAYQTAKIISSNSNILIDDRLIERSNGDLEGKLKAGVGIYIRCYFEGEVLDGDYSKYKMKNCEILKYYN